jgi:hypothetical protein
LEKDYKHIMALLATDVINRLKIRNTQRMEYCNLLIVINNYHTWVLPRGT